MPRLHIVSTSTRPVSLGRPLASWVAGIAEQHGGFEVTPVDLAEINLPFLDEPEQPAARSYVHPHTHAWSALVESADALLFVLPMYNGSFTAPLKNAIDFLYHEWKGKAVALVSYSAGPTGGAPAAAAIRPVFERLGTRLAEQDVAVPGITRLVGPEGTFTAPEGLADELTTTLDQLAKLLTEEPVTA
ncbi:NAD(P)H-dependent oxidoreductase [Streptomyces sp. NPDC051211]|uniref:NADPH-dependent FMN reductase n=1 Tax=Streptomyces sp. NPDC051211 TaxID=3154643 RepID=UPI00344BA3CC